MPQLDQIRKAVQAYVDSFNEQDKNKFLRALSDGVVQIDPVGSKPNVGKQALGEFWDTLYSRCEKVDFSIADLIISGDEAALTFHITQYLPGGTVDVDGIDVFTVDDTGKIAQVKGYSDADHIQRGGNG